MSIGRRLVEELFSIGFEFALLCHAEETPDLINVQPSNRWTALHQARWHSAVLFILLRCGLSMSAWLIRR